MNVCIVSCLINLAPLAPYDMPSIEKTSLKLSEIFEKVTVRINNND